jgi:hypothetical protein
MLKNTMIFKQGIQPSLTNKNALTVALIMDSRLRACKARLRGHPEGLHLMSLT